MSADVNGLLDLEISNILTVGANYKVDIKYSIVIHTVDTDHIIPLLTSVEVLRDFNGNVAEIVLIDFRMGMGDFIKDIYPNRNNLEATLAMLIDNVPYIKRYKFVVKNNKSGVYSGRYTALSRTELNNSEQVNIEGQCISPIALGLKNMYADGIYPNTNVNDIIHAVIGDAVTNNLTINNETPELNFDITEPKNGRVYTHIEIPTGTEILNLPSFLQNTNYGVYNGNIGTFIQPTLIEVNGVKVMKDFIFIYPLYSTLKFEDTSKKVIIYASSSHKYDNVEHTFYKDGDIINLLSNASTVTMDDHENTFINTGNAMVVSDPNTIMNRNVNVTDDDITAVASSQVSGTTMFNSENGVDKATVIPSTNNLFKYRSEIVKKKMSFYRITWHFCDPTLIYPGMPVAYKYNNIDLGIVTLKGTVQSIYYRHDPAKKTTSALLNIAVEKASMVERAMSTSS